VTPCYSVGIDVVTTNSAIAEVDLAIEPAGPGEPLPGALALEVPQTVAPGEVAPRPLLPSFLYLPSRVEAPEGAFDLPWGASPDSDRKSTRLNSSHQIISYALFRLKKKKV